MAKYEIKGGNPLNGEVLISGAKNAAVAILPAAVLVEGVCRVENVPDISDVRILLNILEDMGAVITREGGGTVLIDQPNGTGTRITMTLAIRQNKETILRSPVLQVDYTGGFDHALVELSDCLSSELY